MEAAPTAHPCESKSIGIIGLGLMGNAFARRLLAADFHVVGYDLDGAKREALELLGGMAATSAQEVAMTAERLMLSLPDHHVAGAVLEELLPVLRPGQIFIDTTTGAAEAAEQQAAALAGQGVIYLDATVSGSSAQVASGDAVLMVGGSAEGFARCRDVFGCAGPQAFHTGSAGTGAKMKLVTNLVLGINRAALAEGLAFAERLGLDGRQTLEVLRASAAYSRIMDTKGGKMLQGDFTPVARLSQHLKDVRLMLEAAAAAGMVLPLSRTHRELLEAAVAAGYGALDNSAIIRVFNTTTPPTP